MELILGIDEAGRGPVIGPMAIAGCLITPGVENELRRLGVKDSKELTQKRREFLEEKIKAKAKAWKVALISPAEIDESKKHGLKLNELEAIAASKIINALNKKLGKVSVVVDCPSPNKGAWREFLMLHIEELSNLHVACEHKADKNHIAVAAASILAKSEREREVKKLKEKYGDDIGSGYSHDPITRKFLEKNIKKHDGDGIFRKSWRTWQEADSKSKQKKLDF